MKSASIRVIALLMLALSAAVVNASDKKADAPKAAKAAPAEKTQKKIEITGSLIPQTVEKHGTIAVTGSPLRIYDRERIESSGAGTVIELMRRYR